MKIIHNNQGNSGSGGGDGLGQQVGDVYFSYNFLNQDTNAVDITYSAFQGDPEEYPNLIVATSNPPTLAGLPVTAEYSNSNLPYPVSLYEFNDHFWAAGKNIFDGTKVRLTKMAKGKEWQQLETYDIDVGHNNIYEKIIFDGENFYIYQEAGGGFEGLINSFIKFSTVTKTHEKINFKSKRIAKSYFDNTINKFVVYEVNATNNNDSDMSKNGIYYYDTFEELKNVADVSLNRYAWSSNQIAGLIRNFKYGTLRKKDGQIIYYDVATKQLRDYSTNNVFAALIGEAGTNTNVTQITGIFELYNKVFCSYIDSKNSVNYTACLCKEPEKETAYAFPLTMSVNAPYIIYDQIFDHDFSKPEPQAPAIIYKDKSNIRKALTFNKVKDNQYEFSNISSVNPPSDLYDFRDYMSQDYWHINTKAIDDLGYRVYDDFGLIGRITYKVVNMKFDGFGIPYIYIPPLQVGNLLTYLIVKK